MALSDAEREKDKKRAVRPIKADTNARWSDKQKIEAIQTYLAIGNLALTSRITGIPEITLRVGKTAEWWKKVVEDIKIQEKVELSNKLKQLVNAAQTVVANRLEQGDPYVDPKSGEVKFKPVNMRDAHRVAVDSLNQKVLLEKGTFDSDAVAPDAQDKLEALANKFAEFAVKKIEQVKRTVEVTDVIYMDKNHENDLEGASTIRKDSGNDSGTSETQPPNSDSEGAV